MIVKLVNGGRRVVYVDITDWIGLKLEAVKAHESQVPDAILGLLKRVFALIGAKAGYRYAEAFKVLNANTLHCNICGRPIA